MRQPRARNQGSPQPINVSIPQREPSFDDFLIAEYEHIANAHFNTAESISSFFKHYLVIASLPISVVAVALASENLKIDWIRNITNASPFLLPVSLSAVALVGLCILAYVINLRCDALLYARTVNGIRKKFYADSSLSIGEQLRIRVLPKSIGVPLYEEMRSFLFVVLAFALIGTGYLILGWYPYLYNPSEYPTLLLLLATAGIEIHLFLYWWIARFRERVYLRGYRIGVDVDGVLNDHRSQFSTVLKERTGKALDPELITRIPVHELNLGVTEQDEHDVFNWPHYWRNMPLIAPTAPEFLRKVRNLLGYKVWIFTFRGWPHPQTFPNHREQEYVQEWSKAWWPKFSFRVLSRLDHVLERIHLPSTVHALLMKRMTKKWLDESGYIYDKLIVERGNTHIRDPRFLSRNRFVLARERGIRIFVEDDLTKALKLADICELVFLLDQPYNQCATVPRNLVRVKSWQHIYTFLRNEL